MQKHYLNIVVKELPHSEIEITGEITAEYLAEKFKNVLQSIAKDIELPGFRKGHVPENIALQKYGEMNILEDAARHALEDEYPKIIEEKKLEVIGRPNVSLTKIARGNPLGFSFKVGVTPNFSLPDYKSIAQKVAAKKETFEVSEKEIDDVVLEVRKHHAHMEMHKSGTFTDHNHAPVEEKDLPLLTEEMVPNFGDFKNIADLREKIKENLSKEKEMRDKEKKRLLILENIISETTIDVPEVLVESELDKMVAQFDQDVAKAGLSFEDYLKNINKTLEDIRREWHETALKKAKVQLVVTAIAGKEKIAPETLDIQKETEKILILHKDADPLRVRIYVAMMLTNEKVFEFLESPKQ